MLSASPYLILSNEKSVVEHNPGENFVFLSVTVDAFPSSWTVEWLKDGDVITGDNPRLITTYACDCNSDDSDCLLSFVIRH